MSKTHQLIDLPPQTAENLMAEVAELANSTQAQPLQRFFKTGAGQYAEGDILLGLTVPQSRAIAKRYLDLPDREIQKLFESAIHEHRFAATVILTERFRRAKDELTKAAIFDQYLNALYDGHVNNWDLVDVSAPTLGNFLVEAEDQTFGDRLLDELASSDNLWRRRASVIFTFAHIRAGIFEPTLHISRALLGDKHDLIHKACGWMLREVGKRDANVLRAFLLETRGLMPRTELRYAIEKFDEDERQRWLSA
jgi:3-methyladenine DNA glycosylase AlkD